MMLDAKTRHRALANLKAKRAEVAAALADLLAGQNITLTEIKLPQEEDPSEPPVERLRRFMWFLERADARLRSGEAASCARCGRPIAGGALVETPWADTCLACAAG